MIITTRTTARRLGPSAAPTTTPPPTPRREHAGSVRPPAPPARPCLQPNARREAVGMRSLGCMPTFCGWRAPTNTHTPTHTHTHSHASPHVPLPSHPPSHTHTHARTHACANAQINAHTHTFHPSCLLPPHPTTHTHIHRLGTLRGTAPCWLRRPSCTRHGPFNFTPVGVNSTSPALLHARPMWALSTCRAAGEIKKKTHPESITARLRDEVRARPVLDRLRHEVGPRAGPRALHAARAPLRAAPRLDRPMTCPVF